MNLTTVAERLWGNKAKFSTLFIAACILLFTFLGARDLWTQEHRWADIVASMFYRHDYFHPYVGSNRYYDKPLLSYWLIALVAKLVGTLSAWCLRFPSVVAGLVSLYAITNLGTQIKHKSLGLLAGWLLLTTFYFVFWARTSSADMLNLAGSLFAVSWYFTKRDCPSFLNYAVFFVTLALTSLCKGLIGAVVPTIVVVVSMMLEKSWKLHLRLSFLAALLVGVGIYFLPFFASEYYFIDPSYKDSALYLVYKENFLRYFQPFDHQGSIYLYLIYLPIYLLPWAVFFIPAVFSLPLRWKKMSTGSKWVALSLLALFLFFSLSGSRRSYYVLPMVPFAILLIADFLLASRYSIKLMKWSLAIALTSYLALFLMMDVLWPWYYKSYGITPFAQAVKKQAEKCRPWPSWNFVLLDAETKVYFYLDLPPHSKNYEVPGKREEQTRESLLQDFPIIKRKPAHTIFITRKRYATLLKSYFHGYKLVEVSRVAPIALLQESDVNIPVAFIPDL